MKQPRGLWVRCGGCGGWFPVRTVTQFPLSAIVEHGPRRLMVTARLVELLTPQAPCPQTRIVCAN